MEKNLGEVLISPKVIYVVETPTVVDEDEKIELLKKDILLIEHDGCITNLDALKKSKSKYSAYFFNLENMIIKNRVKKEDLYSFSANIATFIKNFAPDKSLVHTSFIDDEISNIFRSEGIPYIEKNLRDRKVIYSTLLSTIRPFFIENQRIIRSNVRLKLSDMKYKVEIISINNKYCTDTISGYIKDLSLNGLGIILNNKYDFKILKLKDRLKIKLYLNRSIIKLETCFITRLEKHTKEIGLNFDISDEYMIKHEYSRRLTSIFYNWMRTLIDTKGKLLED